MSKYAPYDKMFPLCGLGSYAVNLDNVQAVTRTNTGWEIRFPESYQEVTREQAVKVIHALELRSDAAAMAREGTQ